MREGFVVKESGGRTFNATGLDSGGASCAA
jgi:hypothetical protein